MLELEAVGKNFVDDAGINHKAVEGVDLRVNEHEIIALVGTSGCGKSTLLRIVSGLEQPTEGRVLLEGNQVIEPSANIAMVFQEPRLMPWLSVYENIRLVLLDLPAQEQQQRIDEALAQVGLSGFRDALPRQLSGGMAQRAAIARALVRKPDILLLDEPFSALDSFTRAGLQQHLLELWKNARFTLIFVTHDIEEAVVLADRIVILRGTPGRLHQELQVKVPHPRARTDASISRIKDEVVAALDLSF